LSTIFSKNWHPSEIKIFLLLSHMCSAGVLTGAAQMTTTITHSCE